MVCCGGILGLYAMVCCGGILGLYAMVCCGGILGMYAMVCCGGILGLYGMVCCGGILGLYEGEPGPEEGECWPLLSTGHDAAGSGRVFFRHLSFLIFEW